MLPTEHASTAGLLGGYSRVRTGHSFRGRLNEKVGGRQAVWPKGCGEWRSQVVTVGLWASRRSRPMAPRLHPIWIPADCYAMTGALDAAELLP